MSHARRLLCIASLAIFVLAPALHADDAAEAKKRFAEGAKALDASRFREAALHFESALRLKPHAIASFSAATAWDKAEEPARAADDYARALELSGLPTSDQKAARERLASLEESLGTAAITGPSDVVVQFERSTEASPPTRLHGAPGVHTLIIVRGGNVERRDVVLKSGETIRVDVGEAPPAPAPSASSAPAPPAPPPPVSIVASPPPPPPATPETRKLIGYSVMGAGVLTAGVAVWVGVRTLSAREDYNGAPTRDAYDHATSMRLWTNVAWAGAAVLGGVGAALVFWPSGKPAQGDAKPNISLSPMPAGLQLQGAF